MGFMTRLWEEADDRLDFLCRRMQCSHRRLLFNPRRKSAMSHFLASDDRYRNSIHDEDCWSRRINKRNSSRDYRFGRPHGKPAWGSARATSNRMNGCLRSMIEVIADSKLRRMERELELQGIHRDRLNGSHAALKPRPAELSRGSN